ncbi:MAG TPA: FtsH protease activity modulator HflK [Burkholderiaceae bacterium]|nr:FtsH protease activity modulator HflK [Burkholderiaceae bacterium]
MIGFPGLALSLNDPRWGRNNDDSRDAGQDSGDPRRPSPQGGGGPPDLEDLWRDLNRKLSGMFGRGGRGDGGRFSGGSNGRGTGLGVGLIAGVAALIWLASGFYIVPEGQQAVVLTFGKLSRMTTRAGLQWRLPQPIESHELVNVSSVRSVEIGYRGGARTKVPQEALMLTDDENIIDIQFAVQYRIREDGAADFLFNNRNPEDTVKQAAETSMREVVGRKTMDLVLYESRADVAADVQKLMQSILDRYRTGVLVMGVAIQQAQPPEQVQAAFEDANRAQQDRERQINEGQAYANDVIPKARGTASRLIQEAEGYRQRVVDTATGDASRFKSILSEYAKAPVVTRERMYIDTMQQIFQNTTKVMVDVRSSSPMLYLPLDQIVKQSAADASATSRPSGTNGGSAPTGSTTPVPEPAATATENRVRETLRSRDRDSR